MPINYYLYKKITPHSSDEAVTGGQNNNNNKLIKHKSIDHSEK